MPRPYVCQEDELIMSLTEKNVDLPLEQKATGDFETDQDALKLARETVRARLIGQDVLDHLISLHPQVPNSMKLRYLMSQLHESISGDKQLFFKMVKVLVAFQSVPANLASDIPLTTDHIADLAELLVPYASEWRSIGTALKFKPQDLNNIEARRSLKDVVLKLIDDWILKKHEHTLSPTVNNLESALKSHVVGLGVLACEVRTNFARNQPILVKNQALPYFVANVEMNRRYDACQNYLETEENMSVLLDVQVVCGLQCEQKDIGYQWLVNNHIVLEDRNHTGVTTPVLCVSNADIWMDGSKYSCRLTDDTDNYDDDDNNGNYDGYYDDNDDDNGDHYDDDNGDHYDDDNDDHYDDDHYDDSDDYYDNNYDDNDDYDNDDYDEYHDY